MGFAGFIGGILLMVVAVIIAILGIAVLLGLLSFLVTSYNVPIGLIILVIALLVFAYGWYLYKSSKPKGTINVHNV